MKLRSSYGKMSEDTSSEQQLGTAGDRQDEQQEAADVSQDDSEAGAGDGDGGVVKAYIRLKRDGISDAQLPDVVEWLETAAVEYR
jgi:hypothetical protein